MSHSKQEDKPDEFSRSDRGKRLAKKGPPTDTLRTLLQDKLLFGYNTYYDALSSMRISVATRVVHLPISTRAFGFITRFLVRKFACLGIINNLDPHALCCALYRVHLIMYEIRLANARSVACFRNSPIGDFEDIFVDSETGNVIAQLGTGFSVMANLLSSIGILHAFNTTYVPCHPVATAYNQVRQVDPSLITYSNLRNVVVAMSAVATNQETRMWFYEHNPIPGARWSERTVRQADGSQAPNPDFPLLLNANEIMPPDYGIAQIRADVDMIQTSLELVGRKYPKYTIKGMQSIDGTGNFSMLVCNMQKGLRCADLHWRQENEIWVPNYSTNPALTSGETLFWSMDKLSEPEFYAGILHLLGELPRFPPPSFSARKINASKMEASHSFADALGNLMG